MDTHYSKFIILSPNLVKHVALTIEDYLKKQGINFSTIISSERDIKFDNTALYLILCPNHYKKFPKYYIAYSMEPMRNPYFYFNGYLKKLKNSLSIIDYSQDNISVSSKIFKNKTFYYLPITFYKNYDLSSDNRMIETLFYGNPTLRRRMFFKKQFKNNSNLFILFNVFDEKLSQVLSNTKIVINVHNISINALETARIYEAASHGCLIISENSKDAKNYSNLDVICDFFKNNSKSDFLKRVLYWQKNPDLLNKKNKEIIEYVKNSKDILFEETLNKIILDFNLKGYNSK